jgi:hypothetical protein
MSTKRVSLFAKVLDVKEPFLEFEDFGDLKFYHPSDLSKSATLRIVEINENIEFLSDSRLGLAKKYEELRNVDAVKIDAKNKEQRQKIYVDLRKLELEIQAESLKYLEVLAKLNSGELEKRIDILYVVSEEAPNIEREDLIELIFTQVNEGLRDYNQKETGTPKESKGFDKGNA